MEIQSGRFYRHYKGKMYKVISVGFHSETLEKVVVYESQYDDPEFGKNAVWVRPYDMFIQVIEHEGQKIPRFKLIT